MRPHSHGVMWAVLIMAVILSGVSGFAAWYAWHKADRIELQLAISQEAREELKRQVYNAEYALQKAREAIQPTPTLGELIIDKEAVK